ncbi:WD40-repeat-containing domain protein [Scheffersomyces coipomensis]|uniref:WD40-repeat-containing domain protein n=1 Tax=Scheffersomyces coipomensis TaxID=1788519 RepID=UPI00315C56AC
MGKQYISTVNAAQAHKSDIVGLSVTDKFTISVSSDGTAHFWDNQQKEAHNPTDFVIKKFINKVGLHHIATYENVLPDSTIKVVLIAFASFDGSITLNYYLNDDITTWKEFEDADLKKQYWAPGFYKDPESKQDYFVITKSNGASDVFNLNIKDNSKSDISISLEKVGELNANKSAFPNALAISPTSDKKVAVGYTNGEVYIYDLESLKPIYTFHSSDLQVSGASTTSASIPRVIEFSPGGTLLAVARDNQSSGSITLYDVKFGENVGTLTTPSHSSKAAVGGFAHSGWIMGLSFDEAGENLVSCGFDKCIRVWNLETREREATITISITDLEDTEHNEQYDKSVASGVSFIKKGIRGGAGGDKNEGLCVISFDRGIRWYREAGGV